MMRLFTKQIRRWVKRIAAFCLIIAGIVTFPLPIPIGAILIAFGLAMMLTTSKNLTSWVKRHRIQQSRLNAKLQWLETRLPRYLAKSLRKTAPDYGKKPSQYSAIRSNSIETTAKNVNEESQ